jgi:penicillin amidase
LSRFLKYINLLIALVLLAAAGVVWWFGYRVLAKTSGSVEAPVAAPVQVVRDELGVPHFTAQSEEDALFVQGYVTAQDRLFQMEFVRRQASGTLAEIFGRVALESDLEARRLRLRRVAEQHAQSLRAEDRKVLAAYARGVNYFVETHLGAYPVEYTVLGFDPSPWTMADSVLVGLTMFRALTNSWRDELTKQSMLRAGDRDKVQALFPVRTGSEPQMGSNAWVLAGSRTTSGKPLLANDPHLGFSLPGVWYQVHLKGGGLNVAGVSLPGMPGVVIGHNERIAWGMTNLHFDVQDLYEIRLDAARGLYLDEGKPAQARVERETIRMRGGGTAESLVTSTRLGPIVTSEGGRNYALRWTALEPGQFSYPVLELNRARNWTDFRAALERFPGPAQNFVYADVDGNIGYQVGGLLPIREAYEGDLPVAADEMSKLRWAGYIPFAELPSVFNPASGAIITANQNPFPKEYKYRVSGAFAPHYRARQIESLIARKPKWAPRETLAVQKDVYSAFHHFLAKELSRRGVSPSDERLSRVLKILDDWNGQMEIGQPAPFLTTLVYQHLRKALVERASSSTSQQYDLPVAYGVAETLLKSRPKEWFVDWNMTLSQVLLDAVAEASRIQGDNPDRWDYGRTNQALLKHPIFGDVRFIGEFFRIGPLPMAGGSTTVKQTTPRMGPSMRFIADTATWDASLMNIVTGQSGQPLSGHYTDQWKSYYVGESFLMAFSKVEGDDTLQFVPSR